MTENDRIGKILVITNDINLVGIVQEAVGSSLEMLHASDENQGLEMARKEIPDIIALGYMETQGAVFELHRQLRQGWITRDIPLLIVDLNPLDPFKRVLSVEEGLQVEADDYISLSERDEYTAVTKLAKPIERLRDKLQSRLRERENPVREAILNHLKFCITWEQIPGRGAFEMQQEELIENARRASYGAKVHAVSVTDNPGGNPAISTEILCTEVKRLGIEPLVHLAFRDKNRNQCESLLCGLAALGVRNLLMLTGDYTSSSGFKGMAKPVFDLDSVHGLQLVEMMNAGMEHEVMGRKTTLSPTNFFTGVAVSPFKQQEAEIMGQYNKLKKKIEAGAKFVITQVGYDARKLHELIKWLKVKEYNVPALVNIYILPYGAARTMNANQIPGCVVTDEMLAQLAKEREAKDKGRSARLDRAAKTYAIAKGMGYAGAHIGGHGITYEMVEYVIDKGEELSSNWQDWVAEFNFPQKNGFYLFKRDPKTGLNLDEPALRITKSTHPPIYLFSRIAHATLFNPDSIVFKALKPAARLVDSFLSMKLLFGSFEHISKVALFNCMNCGDCALFDVAFLCPMSQCPKNQRNGPCGGSYGGWCEVNSDKKCVWVRAYERLKSHGEEDNIGDYIVPPCNWGLIGTSSWLNFYLGRDHSAKRLGIETLQSKQTRITKEP